MLPILHVSVIKLGVKGLKDQNYTTTANANMLLSFAGAHRSQNTSHWTRKDFNLITCLVRSKFGEVWQARPRGSNQVVRIRLSAGSDDVYIYDSHLMAKDKNVHTIRNV